MAGHSGTSGGSYGRMISRVTTPSGPHLVQNASGPNPLLGSPLRGTQEMLRRSTLNMVNIRAGMPTISPIATARYRQNAPANAHTFGMAPIVHVRRTAPLR